MSVGVETGRVLTGGRKNRTPDDANEVTDTTTGSTQ